MGVNPYPKGVDTVPEHIEAGELREEIADSQSKRQAITRGRALRKRMQGAGWRLRVWQNCGWHYSVVRGPLQVYVNRYQEKPTYSAMLANSTVEAHHGEVYWAERATHLNDPNKAVEAALRAARLFIKRCQAAVRAAEGTHAPRR